MSNREPDKQVHLLKSISWSVQQNTMKRHFQCDIKTLRYIFANFKFHSATWPFLEKYNIQSSAIPP